MPSQAIPPRPLSTFDYIQQDTICAYTPQLSLARNRSTRLTPPKLPTVPSQPLHTLVHVFGPYMCGAILFPSA